MLNIEQLEKERCKRCKASLTWKDHPLCRECRFGLPDELQGYMEDCEAEIGSKQWFHEVFEAVAEYARNTCEWLETEYLDMNGDTDEVCETVGQMREHAGLHGL